MGRRATAILRFVLDWAAEEVFRAKLRGPAVWARSVGLSALCSIAFLGSANATGSMTACAIRWDGYYTNGARDPGSWAAKALSKPEWRARAPLHANIDSSRITWEPSQETFDAEIHAAGQAKLCWAYLAYGTDHAIDLADPMMRGFALQRKSQIKSEVPYALILQGRVLGRTDEYSDAVAKIVSLMHDENYQKAIIAEKTRPLLFFFYAENDIRQSFDGSLKNLSGPFNSIRNSALAEGLGDPYIVVLAWSGVQAEGVRKAIGADAISRYFAGHLNGNVIPWANFESTVEADWDHYSSATKSNVVPALSTGGDMRAMCETPAPWDNRFAPGDKCQRYAQNPSIGELQTEFRDALGWMQEHRNRDPGRLLLIYSWSECVESGNCLMPTYGDPKGEKLRAVGEVLRSGSFTSNAP